VRTGDNYTNDVFRSGFVNNRPLPSLDPSLSRWSRLQSWSASLLLHSVRSSTRATYITGYRTWSRFCLGVNFDKSLRSPPLDWNDSLSIYPFKISAIIAFMSSLYIEQRKHPKTIRVYLAGVKFWLKSIGQDISFFSDPAVTAVKRGMSAHFRVSEPAADKRTLPITVDFITQAFEFLDLETPMGRCLATAFVLAFTCLLRRSEYVGKYGLLGSDVAFEVLVGSKVRVVSAASHDLQRFKIDDIQGVIINNRRAKNDVNSEGFRFHFKKCTSSSSFDVTTFMFLWAKEAELKPNDLFLSYRGQWSLTYKRVQVAIRKVADLLSLDSSRFSSHSFRIGGASVLAAAGVPDYIILKIGRWKSLAFLDYIRQASSFFSVALSALSDPSLFTLDHLKLINSGVKLI
jgi:hypothetical protein